MLNSNSSQGIGDLVQRKKEAFQSNPGQLQQNYQKNKQLTDLLALQQLKTEKEDAQLKVQQKEHMRERSVPFANHYRAVVNQQQRFRQEAEAQRDRR